MVIEMQGRSFQELSNTVKSARKKGEHLVTESVTKGPIGQFSYSFSAR
jgi:hypothetical protein